MGRFDKGYNKSYSEVITQSSQMGSSPGLAHLFGGYFIHLSRHVLFGKPAGAINRNCRKSAMGNAVTAWAHMVAAFFPF
jgi:hypothetical protein